MSRLGASLTTAAPALAALAALPFVTLLRDHGSATLAADLWALVILMSFVGWGTLLGRWLLPARTLDWGMRSALGMAGVLAFGGLAELLRVAGAATSIAVVAAGLLARIAVAFKTGASGAARPRFLASVRRDPTTALLVFVVSTLALLLFFSNIAYEVKDVYDDFEAYIPFAKSLMQTGSLDEPFSLRRMASLGGQTYLHSLFLSLSATRYLNAVDGGFCFLTLFGLVLGLERDGRAHGRLGGAIGTLVLLLNVKYYAYNTASALSGAVFIFATYRLLSQGFATRRELAAPLALMFAAGWTLRQNYVVTLLALLALAYGLAALADRAHRRAIALNFGRTLALTLALLTPWFIAAYRSSSTFLFPLILGNARADCGLLESAGFHDNLIFFKNLIQQPNPIHHLAAFVLAALAVRYRKNDPAFLALTLAALIGWLATAHALVSIDDVGAVNRYCIATVLAFCLAVLPAALSGINGITGVTGAKRSRSHLVRGAVAAILAFMALAVHFEQNQLAMLTRAGEAAVAVSHEFRHFHEYEPVSNPFYTALQNAVPPGARILVTLGEPQYLDFSRNTILINDQPGRASPGTGLPIGGTADDYARYFKSQNIRYIAYIWGRASPEYDPVLWQALAKVPTDAPLTITGDSRGYEMRRQGRLFVDVFEHLTELRKTHKVLYSANDTYLFDLEQPQ